MAENNGTELAKAYVQIIPSLKGIKGSLGEEFGEEFGNKSGEKAGESLGTKLVSTFKKTVAAAGIGTVIKSAFSEGAALEQSLGGVETLFKKHADIVKRNAENAYKKAGMSANDYMENVTSFSASLISSLAGDTGKAADVADMAMVDMSDNANKFGTDMQSIQDAYQGFAKQNYTMLDNLKLGYGGTKTEMERLLADAEKLSGQKYDISNLSDVYNAIHDIQEDLGIMGTTSEEADKTFSGSFASMKAAAKNLLGTLTAGGDAGQAFDSLTDTTGTFFRNVMRMGTTFADQSVKVFDAAVGEILQNIGVSGKQAETVIGGVHTAIKSITAAVVAFITVSKITAVTKSFEGLSLAMLQGKAMAMAINAEMLVTQGLAAGIAAGVALLGTAIINHFTNAIDVCGEKTKYLSESTSDLKNRSDKLADSISDLHSEMNDSISDTKSQAENYKTLKDRLFELNRIESKSADEKSEMQSIVSQLNGDISGLNLTIDSQTGSLKNNTDIVGKMIDSYAKMDEGEAMQNRLAEATRNAKEAEKAYAEAIEKRNAAKAKGLDINSDEMVAINESVLELGNASRTANEDLELIKTSISEAAAAQQEFSTGFGDTSQYIANISDETLTSINDICTKYQEAYQTQHDLVFDQMDLLDEFCGKSDVTKETLIKNLDENIEGFTEWENNLGKLKVKVANGIISQDFYNNLEEMGPKGAGYAKAFVDMSDQELKKYSTKSKGIFDEMNDYVDRSMGSMRDDSARLLDELIALPDNKSGDMFDAYEMLGNYATDGYAEGIRNGSSGVNEAVREAIQDAIETAKVTQDSHSPSRVFETLGGYAGEGYALGIDNEAAQAAKAARNMAENAVKAVTDSERRRMFEVTGLVDYDADPLMQAQKDHLFAEDPAQWKFQSSVPQRMEFVLQLESGEVLARAVADPLDILNGRKITLAERGFA